MANKRISELTSASELTVGDLLVLVNELQTRKTTIGDLISFIREQELFAELDEDGMIPSSQLPDSITGAVRYAGSWAPSTNTPALGAANLSTGLYYVVSADGTQTVDGISDWKQGDWVVSNGTTWQKIDNSAVLTHVLAGFSSQTGAITAADSILTGFGKTQGQLNLKEDAAKKGQPSGYAELDVNGKVPTTQLPASVLGAANYQGAWNASTNSPAIPTASTANKGYYYVVSTNGTTSINSINDWKLGDWIISNGSAWQKVDNTDAVLSFNSRTGAILPVTGDYNTDQVTLGTVNKYYDAALVRAETLGSGFVPANTAIVSGNGIVTAFSRAQGQITAILDSRGANGGIAQLDSSGRLATGQIPASLLGAANYQGTWNASTNSPAIPTASTSNKGFYYVVSTAGSTTINSINDWKVSDWIISNGSAWQKVDNTDAVTSFNTRIGAILPTNGDYTTDMVTEGSKKFYNGSLVRAETLSGLVTTSAADVTTGDSVLTAFGKLQAQLFTRAAANGIATLDSTTKLKKSQIPKGYGTFDMEFGGYTAGSTSYSIALYGYYIAPGVLSAGDQLNVTAWLNSVATSGTNTFRVYFSSSFTAGVAATGTPVATYAMSTTNYSDKFTREFSFITDTAVKSGVAPGTSSVDGTYAGLADAATTIPSVSGGFWVVLAGQRATLGSLKVERIALTGLFQ